MEWKFQNSLENEDEQLDEYAISKVQQKLRKQIEDYYYYDEETELMLKQVRNTQSNFFDSHYEVRFKPQSGLLTRDTNCLQLCLPSQGLESNFLDKPKKLISKQKQKEDQKKFANSSEDQQEEDNDLNKDEMLDLASALNQQDVQKKLNTKIQNDYKASVDKGKSKNVVETPDLIAPIRKKVPMRVVEKTGPYSYDIKTQINAIFNQSIIAKSKNYELFKTMPQMDVDTIEEKSKDVWEDKYQLKLINNFMDCGSYHGQVDKKGQPHGMGRRIGHGDSIYEGQYKFGQREGYGRQIYPDGSFYLGQWCDRMRDGLGTLTTQEGVVKHGIFEKNGYKGPQPKKVDFANVMDEEIDPQKLEKYKEEIIGKRLPIQYSQNFVLQEQQFLISSPFVYFNHYKNGKIGFAIDKKDLPSNLELQNDQVLSLSVQGLPDQLKDIFSQLKPFVATMVNPQPPVVKVPVKVAENNENKSKNNLQIKKEDAAPMKLKKKSKAPPVKPKKKMNDDLASVGAGSTSQKSEGVIKDDGKRYIYICSSRAINADQGEKLRAQLEKCQGLLPGHGLPVDKFQKIQPLKKQVQKVEQIASPKSEIQEKVEVVADTKKPGHFCEEDHSQEWDGHKPKHVFCKEGHVMQWVSYTVVKPKFIDPDLLKKGTIDSQGHVKKKSKSPGKSKEQLVSEKAEKERMKAIIEKPILCDGLKTPLQAQIKSIPNKSLSEVAKHQTQESLSKKQPSVLQNKSDIESSKGVTDTKSGLKAQAAPSKTTQDAEKQSAQKAEKPQQTKCQRSLVNGYFQCVDCEINFCQKCATDHTSFCTAKDDKPKTLQKHQEPKLKKEEAKQKQEQVQVIQKDNEPDYSWALKQDPVIEINLKIPFIEDDDFQDATDVKEIKLPRSYKKLLPLVQLIERPWEWKVTKQDLDQNVDEWQKFDYLMCRTLNRQIKVYQQNNRRRFLNIGANWTVDLKEMIKFKRNDPLNSQPIKRLPHIDDEDREKCQFKINEILKFYAKEITDPKAFIGLNKDVDSQNRTLSHYACQSGNHEALNELVGFSRDKNIDFQLDRINIHGQTPLHEAAVGAHKAVIEILISAGCNPFVKDNKGLTAYEFLKETHFEKQIHTILKEYMELSEQKFSSFLLSQSVQETHIRSSVSLETTTFSILSLKTKASLLFKSLDSKDTSKFSVLLPQKYQFDEDPKNLKIAQENIMRQAEFMKKYVEQQRKTAILKIKQEFEKKVQGQKWKVDSIIAVVDLVWHTYDQDNNGYLDKDEFGKFAESYISLDHDLKIGHKDVFSQVFRNYDKDSTNSIDKAEMVKLFSDMMNQKLNISESPSKKDGKKKSASKEKPKKDERPKSTNRVAANKKPLEQVQEKKKGKSVSPKKAGKITQPKPKASAPPKREDPMKRKPAGEEHKQDDENKREPLDIPELTADEKKSRIVEVMDQNVSIIGHQDINKRVGMYDEDNVAEEGQGPTVKTNAGGVVPADKAKLIKDAPWKDMPVHSHHGERCFACLSGGPVSHVHPPKDMLNTVSTADSFKVEFVKYENNQAYKFQGYTYTGQFEGGKKNGQGTKIYDESKWKMERKFVGTFNNDKIDGEGKMYRQDGSWQEGQFLDDQLQGPGKHHTAEGNIITGEFCNGLPDGIMKIQYKNGTKFKEDTKKREDNFEKGEEYEGFILNWKHHGQGVLKIPKQDAEVTGVWYHGALPQGQKYWQKKEWVYDGPLKFNTIMDGEGICEVSQNQELHIVEGLFKNDRFPIYGYKTVKNSNQNGFYHGSLNPINGHRSGKGSFHYEDKKKGYFCGQYQKDLKNGYGQLIIPLKEKWTGMFKDDVKDAEDQAVTYVWNEKGVWEDTEDNQIRKVNDKIQSDRDLKRSKNLIKQQMQQKILQIYKKGQLEHQKEMELKAKEDKQKLKKQMLKDAMKEEMGKFNDKTKSGRAQIAEYQKQHGLFGKWNNF